MINLKHIKFGQTYNDDDLLFPFDDLSLATQVTKNIESVVVNLPENEDDFKRFFALFPNLKHIIVAEEITIYPAYLTTVNVNLESLNFGSYCDDPASLNDSSYFPKLKKLSIGELNHNNMCGFINRHSNTLERITIDDCDDLTYETINAILNCAQLKYLELSFDIITVSSIALLTRIALNGRTFTLKLSNSSFTNTFVFPDDKVVWVEKMKGLQLKVHDPCCAVQ